LLNKQLTSQYNKYEPLVPPTHVFNTQ
jgi:hypothetical protein